MSDDQKISLSERKRADIMCAAIEEFRISGYAGARINRIAERANVSKRTLYKHFDGKEALFQGMVSSMIEHYADSQSMVFDPHQPLKTQLEATLKLSFEAMNSDSFMALSRVLVSELLRDQQMMQKVMGPDAMQHEGLVKMIQAALEHGRIREVDPAYAATQLISLVKAFLFWPVFLKGEKRPDPRETDRIISDAVSMFLSHYGLE